MKNKKLGLTLCSNYSPVQSLYSYLGVSYCNYVGFHLARSLRNTGDFMEANKVLFSSLFLFSMVVNQSFAENSKIIKLDLPVTHIQMPATLNMIASKIVFEKGSASSQPIVSGNLVCVAFRKAFDNPEQRFPAATYNKAESIAFKLSTDIEFKAGSIDVDEKTKAPIKAPYLAAFAVKGPSEKSPINAFTCRTKADPEDYPRVRDFVSFFNVKDNIGLPHDIVINEDLSTSDSIEEINERVGGHI
jgi:hypothetical protein